MPGSSGNTGALGKAGRLHYAAKGLIIHLAAHAAAMTARHRTLLLLLRNLTDEAFRGEEQSSDGRGLLQRRAGDLLGIHHAGFDEVFVGVVCQVVALVAFALLNFL